MRTIHKAELRIADEQFVHVAPGWNPIAVGNQRERLCLWYTVADDGAPKSERMRVAIRGTGHDAEGIDLGCYVGTVLTACGSLVWHVFVSRA